MKYLTDTNISKIGLGTGRFGTLVGEETSHELLDVFISNGGTVIDTARNYYEWVENGRGKSEECIGRWLDKRNNRKSVAISTKCGVKNEGKIWDINLSESRLVTELEESLEALRTDYIDIYLLHRDEIERPVEEIVETMQLLKKKGKIKYIGVSNWKFERIVKANEYALKNGMEPFKIVQTWWSLAEYKFDMWNDENTTHMDDDTYSYMMKNNMIGMAYTSQCKGFFQKAILNGLDNVDEFLKKRIVTERNLNKLKYIEDYCNKEKINPTAFVSGYITSNALEGIALISTSNSEHLNEILSCCDYILPDEIIQEIDKL